MCWKITVNHFCVQSFLPFLFRLILIQRYGHGRFSKCVARKVIIVAQAKKKHGVLLRKKYPTYSQRHDVAVSIWSTEKQAKKVNYLQSSAKCINSIEIPFMLFPSFNTKHTMNEKRKKKSKVLLKHP